MTDEQVHRQEEAYQSLITSAFLGVLGAAFLSEAGLAIAQGQFGLALCVLGFALTFAFLAYRWPTLAPRLGQSLTAPFDAAAANAWFWMLLFLIIAFAVLVLVSANSGHLIQHPLLAQENVSERGNISTRSFARSDTSRPGNPRDLAWRDDWAHARLEEFAMLQTPRALHSETEAHNLIAKGNELLQIIRKGVPLFQRWQSLLTVNPERVCLGLDLSILASNSARLSSELHRVQTEQQRFFDQNNVLGIALLPSLNNGKLPASSNDVVEFEVAASSLERYTLWMRGLANHSNCDNIVQTGEMAIQSLSVNQALWRLGFWIGLAQDRIKEFQAHIEVTSGNNSIQ